MTEIPSPLPTAAVVSNTITINKHKSLAAGLVAVIFSIILLVIIGALLQYLQVISLPFLAKSKDALVSAAVDDFSTYFSQNLPYYAVPTKETIKKHISVKDKSIISFMSDIQNTYYLGATLYFFPNTTNLKSIFLVQQTQREKVTHSLDAFESSNFFNKYFSAKISKSPWTCQIQNNTSLCDKRIKTFNGIQIFTIEHISLQRTDYLLMYSCFKVNTTNATSCLQQSFY